MMKRYRTILIVLALCVLVVLTPVTVGHSKLSITQLAEQSYYAVDTDRIPKALILRSSSAVVKDQKTGEWLIQKQSDTIVPIASITKLMTAMVVLDASRGDLERMLVIEKADVDRIRYSRSRLPVGTRLSRADALLIALMSSDNRAAAALGRMYPGGQTACIAAMNAKARRLKLFETHFEDSTGLSSGNVSSARDLVRLVDAAYQYGIIREYTTCRYAEIRRGRRMIKFFNTNRLIQNPRWEIGLSKTGYLKEAGRCLVMQAQVADRSLLIILLDSQGKLTRLGDANRIRKWLESSGASPVPQQG